MTQILRAGYFSVLAKRRLEVADYNKTGSASGGVLRPQVRFGSEADICGATADVRFTPNSDRESGLPQLGMSALPPKADMCSAPAHVRFGPIADISKQYWESAESALHIVGEQQMQLSVRPNPRAGFDLQ